MEPPASTTDPHLVGTALRVELDARVVYSAQAQVATLSKQRLDAQLDAAASRGEADQHRQRLQTLEHQHFAALNEHERVVHQLRCEVAEWKGRAKAAELSSTHSEAESRKAFDERIAELEALVGKLQHELKQAVQAVADKDVERAAAVKAAVAAEQGLAKVERAMATSTDGELRRASATASADNDGCRGGGKPPSLMDAAMGGGGQATASAARSEVASTADLLSQTDCAEGAHYGHAAAEPACVRSRDHRSQPAFALLHDDSTLGPSTSCLLFSLHVPCLGDAGGRPPGAPGSQSRVGGTALPAARTSATVGGHASESTSSVSLDLRIWLPSLAPRYAEIVSKGGHASQGLAAADETPTKRCWVPTAMDALTAQGVAGSAAAASIMPSDGACVSRQGSSSGRAQGEGGDTHESAGPAAAGSGSTVAAGNADGTADGTAAGNAEGSAMVMRAVDDEEGAAEETTTTQQEGALSAAEQEHPAKIEPSPSPHGQDRTLTLAPRTSSPSQPPHHPHPRPHGIPTLTFHLLPLPSPSPSSSPSPSPSPRPQALTLTLTIIITLTLGIPS